MKKTLLFLAVLLSAACAQAAEITVLFTGTTHAMLYPCNCPKDPDGGIARRATMVDQIRKASPGLLLVDSGNFFAGGLLDQYTLNTQLDQQRTQLNVSAMKLMGYDCAAISQDEFNFGKDYLKTTVQSAKFPFISCNLQMEGVVPFILKDISGVKTAVIGLTSLIAMGKSGNSKFIEPKIALKETIASAREKGASLIILLSGLEKNEEERLLTEVKGVNILIGAKLSEDQKAEKIGETVVVRPSWQGRGLGKLSIIFQNGSVTSAKTDYIPLSDKVADHKDVTAILPRCFSDMNCSKSGFTGVCQDPGSINARCMFSENIEIPFIVISVKACKSCNTQKVTEFFKNRFPGLKVKNLFYPDQEARKMVERLGVRGLPVYLFGKELEKDKGFAQLKDTVIPQGDLYMIKPEVSGIAYFLGRQKIKGKFDLFISLYDPASSQVLESVKEFNPEIHFLALEQEKGFDAKQGLTEVEDDLRSVCVQKYYPQMFWDYLACRAANSKSSWWDDCLKGQESAKIRECAKGPEGQALLRENTRINKELGIMFGPAYLIDNEEIFSSRNAPDKSELKKMLGK